MRELVIAKIEELIAEEPIYDENYGSISSREELDEMNDETLLEVLINAYMFQG